MVYPWECVNVKDYSDSSVFDTGNPDRLLVKVILKRRMNIKKLQLMALDPIIELWAIDEVMFQQYGTSCKMWIPPEEKNPVIFHYPGRKKVGYFGAVRLKDGKFVYSRI